eukprot:CAMPEP_0182439224 /NCGR_PEP_ID=MMETSP1167-20130531/86304_1 /TAXON_ID=2988 /ORGANISM="Mallomonas Sp, Strain CCMP3275" /LENGTH=628 /DNA_ID=CAMNT_0024632871 /DNA_START=136 /DNA_END=2022 /DNA_ORIENTATION=-
MSIYSSSKYDVLEEDIPLSEEALSARNFSPGALKKDVIAVAFPALAACLVEPLLTLVDTLCVGKYIGNTAAVTGLAGMAVNGAIFNILAAATAPLCTSTTGIVARTKGEVEIRQTSSRASLSKVLINGLILSLCIGIVTGTGLYVGGAHLLRKVFALENEVFTAALNYLHIRALSVPSILVNNVVIGYSLGMQTMLPPLMSVGLGILVNVLGDWLLVVRGGHGLSGAAIATTVASYVGTAAALVTVLARFRTLHPDTSSPGAARAMDEKQKQEQEQEPEGDSSPAATRPTDSSSVSVSDSSAAPGAGAGAGSIALLSWWVLLDWGLMKQFCSASALLLAGSLVNTLTYSAGSRVASVLSPALLLTSSPVLQVAAHQIAMQVWWFLSFLSVPMYMVAQSLLPADIAAHHKDRLHALVGLIARLSIGVAVSCTVANIALLLTSSPVLQVAAHQIAMQVWWFLSFLSDPLQMIAQSLLPVDIVAGNHERMRSLVRLLTVSALGLAVSCTVANIVIQTCFPFTFTSDARVVSLLQQVTPQAAVAQFFVCLTTALDGVFIGTGQLSTFLSASVTATSAAWLWGAYSVRQGLGLRGYWNSLVVFSLARSAFYLTRLASLKKALKMGPPTSIEEK